MHSRLVAASLALVLLTGCSGAVDVDPPHPTGDAGQPCRALKKRLPDRVSDEERRSADPASPYTEAWGDPAITLRCGVGKPRSYTSTAQLLTVNDIAWLPVPQDADVPTTFYVVERRAYIELEVPKEHSPASDALVDVGSAISATVPKAPKARP